nr:hypothetical protein [Tanacetum cinerariifolium]
FILNDLHPPVSDVGNGVSSTQSVGPHGYQCVNENEPDASLSIPFYTTFCSNVAQENASVPPSIPVGLVIIIFVRVVLQLNDYIPVELYMEITSIHVVLCKTLRPLEFIQHRYKLMNQPIQSHQPTASDEPETIVASIEEPPKELSIPPSYLAFAGFGFQFLKGVWELLIFTCPEANAVVADYNQVVYELENKDPHQLPSTFPASISAKMSAIFLAVASLFFWQWKPSSLAVGTSSASRNSITGSGNAFANSWQWECLVHFIPNRIELISDLVKYQDHYAKVHKYQSQQKKPWTKKQKRDYYMAVIRNNLGWKIKGGVSKISKEEAAWLKRKGIRLEQEEVKKMKTSEEVPKEVKSSEEVSEEKIKEMIHLVPIEEVYVEALQVKHPIIDWKVQTKGQRAYWKITSFFIIAVQTPGSGISILLVVGTPSTDSGNLYC